MSFRCNQSISCKCFILFQSNQILKECACGKCESWVFLVETVFPKEKWPFYRALTFTVIHLGEKLSHLSPHSGNIISCTALFLNYAHGKYRAPEMDIRSFGCLLRISCQTGTGSGPCVSSSVETLPLCASSQLLIICSHVDDRSLEWQIID